MQEIYSPILKATARWIDARRNREKLKQTLNFFLHFTQGFSVFWRAECYTGEHVPSSRSRTINLSNKRDVVFIVNPTLFDGQQHRVLNGISQSKFHLQRSF